MKRVFVLVLAGLCAIVFLNGALAGEIPWEKMDMEEWSLKSLLPHPDDARIIFAGASGAVFKSTDAGKNWRSVLFIKGENKDVNFLSFDPFNKNSVYAGTGNGLFFSSDSGESWRMLFKGKNNLEKECNALLILPGRIYLGTGAGLFVSTDAGHIWNKEKGRLGNIRVLSIAGDIRESNCVYVATDAGVFKTDNSGESWMRVFVNEQVGIEAGEEGGGIDDKEDGESNLQIRHIFIDPANPSYIYLATSRGVYRSQDKAKTWQLLSDYGLLDKDIKFLLICNESKIYASTRSGVFEFTGKRWKELSLDLIAEDFRFLAQDNSGNLYVVSDKGLYRTNIKAVSFSKEDSIKTLYLNDEPQIQDVQEAAIKYAEVEPEKIIRWRRQAAKKALLPEVSVGLGRNVTDLWHWESGSTTKSGDDNLMRGRDAIEWDIRLSWDLSELIFSDDQTNIDVRSRLMVELRDDILDQVTKIYFERLRVKLELDGLSMVDKKKALEKEIRVKELTAYLDALTGGYFSRHIKATKETQGIAEQKI